MKLLPRLMPLVAFTVFSAAPSFGTTLGPAPVPVAASPVSITADGFSTFAGGVATARDNVVCSFNGFTLHADEVRYNRMTNTVEGIGRATLIYPDGTSIWGAQITVYKCLQNPVIRLSSADAN